MNLMKLKTLLLIGTLACIVSFNANAQDNQQELPAQQAQAQDDCFPPCRDGFVCHARLCVEICNPPCGQGYTCNASAQCEQIVTESQAPVQASNQKSQREIQREEILAQRLELRKLRQENIQIFRITTELSWQWVLYEDYKISTSALTLGIHNNFNHIIGIRARAGAGIGYAANYLSAFERDQSLTWSFIAEATPIFGPLKNFFIGPLFWFQYRFFKEDSLAWINRLYLLENGPKGGLGVELGFLFGEKVNSGLNMRFKKSVFDFLDYTFEIGYTYHFLI